MHQDGVGVSGAVNDGQLALAQLEMVGELPVKLHDKAPLYITYSLSRTSFEITHTVRYLGDVHQLRVQLRNDVFHRGMMGILSDQRLLDLYLDAHQLGRRALNVTGGTRLKFVFSSSLATTNTPPSSLPARGGTLHLTPEPRCRRNSWQTEWLGLCTPNAASARSPCCDQIR